MTNYIDTDLFNLAKLHANAAAELQYLRNRAAHDKEGILAITNEEARLRRLIFECRPTSNQEAQTKLLYVVNFLGSTKNSLSHDELATIMGSIAHLL